MTADATTINPTEIGPTLDDLAAFWDACDKAMDGLGEAYDQMLAADSSRGALAAMQNVINEMRAAAMKGHPYWDEFAESRGW